ncbi:MAG: hypothetical protein AAF926_00865 [Pseudomonadota bacterium]
MTAFACGLIARGSPQGKMLIILLFALAAIPLFTVQNDSHTTFLPAMLVRLSVTSVTDQTFWFLIGSAAGLLCVLGIEGLFDRLRPSPIQAPVGPLGARDELLARLCLYAFQDSRRSILADLETALGARSGSRQHALQRLAAPGVGGMRRVQPEALVKAYRRAHDPELETAPLIYSVLCRLAVVTGCNTAVTTKRLHRIGQALDLSRGTVNRAISLA